MKGKIAELALLISMFVGMSAASAAEQDPTVLVTGGNRGLGLAWVEKYADQDWNVIATARRPEAATELRELADRNNNVRIEKLDITAPDSVDALAKRLDGVPIDLLINNAGMIGEEAGQKFGDIDSEAFDTFMRANALGALLVTEALMPNLLAGEQKKVAAISAGVASFDVYPRIHRGLYHYKASKVALNMIMINLALDLRDEGIVVAVLSPGVVQTSGEPMNREDMSPQMRRVMIDIDTSVDGMMGVLNDLTLDGSGKWYRYNGEVIPW